jgi:hypothetical protein
LKLVIDNYFGLNYVATNSNTEAVTPTMTIIEEKALQIVLKVKRNHMWDLDPM